MQARKNTKMNTLQMACITNAAMICYLYFENQTNGVSQRLRLNTWASLNNFRRFLMNDNNSPWYFVPLTEDVALTTNDERCLPFILQPRALFFFLSCSSPPSLSFALLRCLCVGWARWQSKMIQMLAAVHFTVVIAVENLPCQTFSLNLMSKTE